MHELRIAEDLAGIVLDAAGEEGLTRVSGVNVTFGQMIQIVPEIFEFAFHEAVKGTVASQAVISFEILPVKLKCMKCGSESFLQENYFNCDTCGSSSQEIIQGKELFIKSIEGE